MNIMLYYNSTNPALRFPLENVQLGALDTLKKKKSNVSKDTPHPALALEISPKATPVRTLFTASRCMFVR